MLKKPSGLRTKSSFIIGLSLLSSLSYGSVPRPTAQIRLDPASGEVEFKAVGRPSAIKIVGKGSAPTGEFVIEQHAVTGHATFALNSLQTGIGIRDQHMKERYLEVGKYPQAELSVTHLQLPAGADLSKGDATIESVPFEGKLKLHGIEKPVSGTAKVATKGGQLEISAQFGLKVADYGISQPKFAGITMADEVQVAINSHGKMGPQP